MCSLRSLIILAHEFFDRFQLHKISRSIYFRGNINSTVISLLSPVGGARVDIHLHSGALRLRWLSHWSLCVVPRSMQFYGPFDWRYLRFPFSGYVYIYPTEATNSLQRDHDRGRCGRKEAPASGEGLTRGLKELLPKNQLSLWQANGRVTDWLTDQASISPDELGVVCRLI